MQSSVDPLPRRFGDYFLFDKIGEGGMARIYLSRQKTKLGAERLVAVKQILPFLSKSAEFARLLIDEAKLAAQLSHSGIVQVYDLGREEDLLFIAMEYVEGFDLNELLRRCARSKIGFPIEFSLFIICEALKALSYAHHFKNEQGLSQGVVHRDVSPSNVLISFDGEVKLCDFGIARAIGVESAIRPEAIQGKAGYMSPEAAGGLPLNARADVFSAGIILWELLAGRRLYKTKKGQPPSLERAIEAEIPPLLSRGYEDEKRLFGICLKALAKQPEDRYPSGTEFLHDLEEYVFDANLIVSPLRLGRWLMETFGQQIVEVRRARERAARALDLGPLLQMRPAVDPEQQAAREAETVPETPVAPVASPRFPRVPASAPSPPTPPRPDAAMVSPAPAPALFPPDSQAPAPQASPPSGLAVFAIGFVVTAALGALLLIYLL